MGCAGSIDKSVLKEPIGSSEPNESFGLTKKDVFEEESNEFKELHEMHSQLIELTEFKYMALQVDDYSQCRELLLEISKVRKQRIHFLSEINLSDKLNSVLTKHKDHEKMSNADFLAELEKRKNQRLLSL